MNILVFVKQVPDTDDVKLDPRTGTLMRDGVQSVINPVDANGVETALQLKEQCGGKVIAISMGPPQADDVLKKALAMGCDESVLLSDPALGRADTLATGYPLAKAADVTRRTPKRLRPVPSLPLSWVCPRSRWSTKSASRTVTPSAAECFQTGMRLSRSSCLRS